MTLSTVVDDSFRGLLPDVTIADEDDATAEQPLQPDKTYRLDLEKLSIYGEIDHHEAVSQAVFKRLITDRAVYDIYSENYGLKVNDLIGLSEAMIRSELQRRITETLLEDERVLAVTDFNFKRQEDMLLVTFTANTIYGSLNVEREYET